MSALLLPFACRVFFPPLPLLLLLLLQWDWFIRGRGPWAAISPFPSALWLPDNIQLSLMCHQGAQRCACQLHCFTAAAHSHESGRGTRLPARSHTAIRTAPCGLQKNASLRGDDLDPVFVTKESGVEWKAKSVLIPCFLLDSMQLKRHAALVGDTLMPCVTPIQRSKPEYSVSAQKRQARSHFLACYEPLLCWSCSARRFSAPLADWEHLIRAAGSAVRVHLVLQRHNHSLTFRRCLLQLLPLARDDVMTLHYNWIQLAKPEAVSLFLFPFFFLQTAAALVLPFAGLNYWNNATRHDVVKHIVGKLTDFG